jgi:hypothetical protein
MTLRIIMILMIALLPGGIIIAIAMLLVTKAREKRQREKDKG